MKIILRIVVILLVATIVSGGFYLLANNTSLALGSGTEHGQPPPMTSTNGQTLQQPEGGGNLDSLSLSRGLAGIGQTFAKLTGITIIIVLIEKAISLVHKRKWQPIT